MKLKVTAAALALVFSGPVFSALDLKACLTAAWEQSPDAKAAQARIAQAQGALDEAVGRSLPELNASMAWVRSDNPLNVFGMQLQQGVFDPVALSDPNRVNNPNTYANYNPALELKIPLWNGGLLSGYRQTARAYVSAAEQGYSAVKQMLGLYVVQAYEGVHTAQAYLQVADEAVKAARSFLKVTESLHTQGMVVKSELLNAQVHLANTEVMRLQAHNQMEIAKAQLALLMGSNESSVEVAQTHEIAAPQGDLLAIKNRALERNPQILAMRHQVEAGEGQVSVAQAGHMPSLNAFARSDWNAPDFSGDYHRSQTYGMALQVNVYSFGAKSGAKDRALAQKMEWQDHLRKTQSQVGFQVEQAYRLAQEAQARVSAHELSVKQAQEAMKILNQRYQNGLSSLTEVLISQTRLDKARADLVAAQYDLKVQNATLWAATGELGTRMLSGDKS